MGASAAETPTQPDAHLGDAAGGIRASDAERDEVVARLAEEFAAGRLSKDTFVFRMNAVLQARHQADLPPLLAGLPGALPPAPLEPPPARPWRAGAPHSLSSLGSVIGRLRPGVRLRFPWRYPRVRIPVPLEFPRGGDSFRIGRNRDCDLVLAHLTVSRVHARLDRTHDGWLLTDLGSTNGTRVNGWRVRGGVPVRPGDLVSFGDAVYVLSAAD
jgi:FHA domain-containing protein/uncharacterized protein DUF1707